MNDRTSLVTILLPCRYPHEQYFRLALESVAAQTCARWALTVVADTDDPQGMQMAQRLLAELNDERAAILRNDRPGVTSALNAGMRAAETPFVCSLHCDDLLAPEAIETLERSIQEHPRVDFFHTARRIIDDDGRPISSVHYPPASVSLEEFKSGGPVKHLHCWRVAAALSIGGMDETLGPHGADDYDFTWSMAEAGFQFWPVRECLYSKREHRSSYRLTTHVPLDVQIGELRKIWTKHGLTDEEMERQIEKRTQGYLREALYRDEQDRKEKEEQGYDIRNGWRQPYR